MDTLLSTLLVVVILAALVWAVAGCCCADGAGDAGFKRRGDAVRAKGQLKQLDPQAASLLNF